MDYNELIHKTVNQLRDEAKKLDMKGVTGMKKDELIAALAEALHLEIPVKKVKKPKKIKTNLTKGDLKKKIRLLRDERAKARSANEHKKVDVLRRRIHTLKRQLRMLAVL
jgi:hypothetical protein